MPGQQARRIYERPGRRASSTAGAAARWRTTSPAPGTAGPPRMRLQVATDPQTGPNFYDATLKEFVNPWTNRNQSAFVPVQRLHGDRDRHDPGRRAVQYGAVREHPLHGQCAGPAGRLPRPITITMRRPRPNGVDFASALQQTTQTAAYGTPAQAVAGIWTTRAGAAAFFVLGTNRAQFRFTMLNYLCHDMQTVMDNTRPTDRIRQDVARSPGGDSRVFLNNCAGCHSGMDPDGAGVRLLRFQHHHQPARVHARAGAAEIPEELAELPLGLRHAGRYLVEPLALGAERRSRLGHERPAAARARRLSARSSKIPTHSPTARSSRSSSRCACAHR